MSEATDTTRLLAHGAEITLIDGSRRRLVLRGEVLAELEEEFDGLEAFTTMLRRRPLTTIAQLFRLCWPDDTPPDRSLWRTFADTRRLDEYTRAIGDALEEALPEQDVTLVIVQNHEHEGRRFQAGTTVEVPSGLARHLLTARVAKVPAADLGNGEAAPGASPGAASSTSRSSSGALRRRRSGG